MKYRLLLGPLSLAALLGAMVLIVACDSGSTTASFVINPATVSLGEDEASVVLTAVGGGVPIRWSVTDTNLGVVSGSDEVVTYTRTAGTLGANTVQATDANGNVATAVITQGVDPDPIGLVTIAPETATVPTDGGKIVFTADGGIPPYAWKVGIATRGRVSSSDSKQATYTRLAEGDNTIQVTDSDGKTAIAQITQPGTPPLAISPSSATVSSNGVLVISAVGGSGTYTWSIATGNGTVSPATGNSTVFTSTDGGVDVVSLNDGATTVFATIGKN